MKSGTSRIQTNYTKKMAVFCGVAPCRLVWVYQRFRYQYCLHHQGDEWNIIPRNAVLNKRRPAVSFWRRTDNLTNRKLRWTGSAARRQTVHRHQNWKRQGKTSSFEKGLLIWSWRPIHICVRILMWSFPTWNCSEISEMSRDTQKPNSFTIRYISAVQLWKR
jgi:hypothetical protein